MPRKNHIVNLPGFTVQKTSGYNPIVFDIAYRRKPRCPHCDSPHLRKKDTFKRQVSHELIGHRKTLLRFQAHKFHCRHCQRYFNQRFPGIGKYQRATERLKEQLCRQHTHGICQKTLARSFRLGKTTIERWYQQHHLNANQQRANYSCPRILGIDEHRFTRKVGFLTTFCDLNKHKVFDIAKGRSQAALAQYLQQLPGKDQVNVVCMDLSTTYKSIVKRYFPKALIVADRFHVIRLLNHQTMLSYQNIDSSIKYQRGLLAALRTNPHNLTDKKKQRLYDYFIKQPAVKAIYDFKQQLHRLLSYKHRTAKYCRRLLPVFINMINQLKNSPFKILQTLGKTLFQWREEIVRMWRFTKSNGITEGLHRKMKLIQRRAYGFKSFDNYRIRVRVLCS